MKNKKTSVLILSPFYSPNIGGVETHLDDLTKGLLKYSEFYINVITYKPLTTKVKASFIEKNDRLSIIRLPWIGHNLFHFLENYPLLEFLYLTPWLFFYTFMFLCINFRSIKVVHAHGFNAAFIGKVLKPIFQFKLFVSTHAIYNLKSNSKLTRIIIWILSSSDKVFTLSKPSYNELLLCGLNQSQVESYRYWIDLERFIIKNKEESKKKLGWQDKFIVLFVGRFIPIKGVDVLLKVAEKSNPNIYYAFIGDGPLAKSVENICNRLDNAIYIGKVQNHELAKYYNASDIFCIPSQYNEGLGRTVLEAMACGIPVVGSNKGGIPEAVSEDVGILVEPSMENLSNTINNLFANPSQLKQLSENCRRHVEKLFSDTNVFQFINYYNND